MTCAHTDKMPEAGPAEADKIGAVCSDCVAIGLGWVRLRISRSCGHVGCCDNSPNRHAQAHWRASDHPIISSMEPREA